MTTEADMSAEKPVGPAAVAGSPPPQESKESKESKSPKTPAVKAIRRSFSSPWATLLVIVLTVVWTIPTMGLFVTSLRPAQDATTTGWWTIFQNPRITFGNYKEVALNGGYGVSTGMSSFFVNSLVISIPATLFSLAIAAMAAYALAWVRFRGSDFLFFTIFALQVVPLQMALVPLLQLFNNGFALGGVTIIPALHLSGTFYPVWIAHTMFALPLAIFLLHNFIAQLPREVMESATVDGANHFLIFRRIVLPLSTPAIASFAIFEFLWVWNDLLVGLTFLGGSPKVFPVTARLSQMAGSYGSHWDLLTAGAFIAIIMPLIVFFTLQRFFVRGLLAGSVKG
jgi:alpha-glucoside transport system permease protein